MGRTTIKRPLRRELFESELLDRAADLFAERGFNGTSLKDLAEMMGMTRPAIYHYFANKESLLEALIAGVTEGRAAELAALRRRRELSPFEQLRAAIRIQVGALTRHPARFRLLIQGEADLPAHLVAKNNKAKRDVLDQLTAIVDAGVASGDFRAIDPRLAAFAVLGMCNWIAWWYKPNHEISAETVIEEYAQMAVGMLQSDRLWQQGGDLASAFKTLHAGLNQLEELINQKD